MKYERIERTLEEAIEFCNKRGWVIHIYEKELLSGKMSVEEYLHIYSYVDKSNKADEFVDFFFKKVEEFKEEKWCWFWDDNFTNGYIAKYRKCSPQLEYKYGDYKGGVWKNCISIEEFRERLKEYL